jgi:hypothetical protein
VDVRASGGRGGFDFDAGDLAAPVLDNAIHLIPPLSRTLENANQIPSDRKFLDRGIPIWTPICWRGTNTASNWTIPP